MSEKIDPALRLTEYAQLEVPEYKVPQGVLIKYLPVLQDDSMAEYQKQWLHLNMWLDCSILRVNYLDLFVIKTTDLLYPVIDDAYLMGRIGCASALSNLYAIGAVDCDNMLLLLAESTNMPEDKKDMLMTQITKGFRDMALEAGTTVTGVQCIVNPLCMIGGVATAVCLESEFLHRFDAGVGDVLVLTKPLGTLIAVTAYQWMGQRIKMEVLKESLVLKQDLKDAYEVAITLMTRLNRLAARLMHKYPVKSVTDVNGSGILAPAQRLACCQARNVSFTIHNLPVIRKMGKVEEAFKNKFKFLQGMCPEINGGLLICLPRDQAIEYCKELQSYEIYSGFIVGVVEKGYGTARVIKKPSVINVPEIGYYSDAAMNPHKYTINEK